MTSNIKKSSQTSQIHKKVDEGLLLWKFSTHTVKKKEIITFAIQLIFYHYL